jgi:hypothetical protein
MPHDNKLIKKVGCVCMARSLFLLRASKATGEAESQRAVVYMPSDTRVKWNVARKVNTKWRKV